MIWNIKLHLSLLFCNRGGTMVNRSCPKQYQLFHLLPSIHLNFLLRGLWFGDAILPKVLTLYLAKLSSFFFPINKWCLINLHLEPFFLLLIYINFMLHNDYYRCRPPKDGPDSLSAVFSAFSNQFQLNPLQASLLHEK